MMKKQLNIEIVCPKCKGELSHLDSSKCLCAACGISYRIFAGIMDMRYPPVDISHNDEIQVAQKLVLNYSALRFEELAEIYFSSASNFAHLTEEMLSFNKKHLSNQLAKGNQLAHMFLKRLDDHYHLPAGDSALDLGCGAGAGLVALAQTFQQVMGVDPNLSKLILARKFCQENNVDNIQLVQAFGQYLPFRDDRFSYVTAQNVFEHVFDIDSVVLEIARILKANGCLAADSRNRYDLFFPEPHVQLHWVGFLPRSWARHYVHWRKGMNYTSAKLLSYWDLRKALKTSFGTNWKIIFPQVRAYGTSGKVDSILAKIEKIKALRQLLLLIFPSHLAISQKIDDAPHRGAD